MRAGHDQHDRDQPGDGQRVQRQAGGPKPAVARGGVCVEVRRHPVRVDDRDEAVKQSDDVQHEDGRQHGWVHDQRDELLPIHPQEEPAGQGEDQDRPCGESQRPVPGANVGLPESGKDQGKEGGRKRGLGARPRALLTVHRG